MWRLTGIGSAVFSLRVMALSTSWPDAVDATYSMSNRLIGLLFRGNDTVRIRLWYAHKSADRYSLWPELSEMAQCR